MLVTWSPCHMTLWLRALDARTFRNLSLCIIPTADRKTSVASLARRGWLRSPENPSRAAHHTGRWGHTPTSCAFSLCSPSFPCSHLHCSHLCFPHFLCSYSMDLNNFFLWNQPPCCKCGHLAAYLMGVRPDMPPPTCEEYAAILALTQLQQQAAGQPPPPPPPMMPLLPPMPLMPPMPPYPPLPVRALLAQPMP